MKNFFAFLNSSVGRKLLMALTGIFLCSFLVVHLTINLFLFASDGGGTYNAYSDFMATYPLIRPIEWVLFGGFLVHVLLGVILWLYNRRARPSGYEVNRQSDSSALSSRIMFWTGAFVFVFLVVHINTFFISSRFFEHDRTMYQMVADAFKDPWYGGFYIVALGFLGYHLLHGFQSAFQTFGLRHPKYKLLIDAVAVVYCLLIPLAFDDMPVYFYLVQ